MSLEECHVKGGKGVVLNPKVDPSMKCHSKPVPIPGTSGSQDEVECYGHHPISETRWTWKHPNGVPKRDPSGGCIVGACWRNRNQ